MTRLSRAALLLAACAWVAPASAQDQPAHEHDHAGHAAHAAVTRTTPWTREIVDLADSLPVQDGGRIKPLHTFAGFTLLRFNGKRSLKTPAGEALSATEWLLDVIFYAEQASEYEIFRVDDIAVVREFGGPTEGKEKRDRWSFAEIAPHSDALFERAREYEKIDPKQRDTVQQHVVTLAENVHFYSAMISFLAMFPPTADTASAPTWLSLADLDRGASAAGGPAKEHAAMYADLQKAATADDMAEFHTAFAGFVGRAKALARARGEYEKIGLELAYYKSKLLDYSHYAFVLGFLLVAFVWLKPRSKWIYGLTTLTAWAGVLAIAGVIVMRCMIRGRPPVSTLYETLLFVTAVGTLSALVMEWINRRKLALSAAVALGMLGIFLANKFEALDGRDTMPQLVAVLDTNFWLATHVTSITIGYSAGMLAALLASAYLISKLLGIRKSDPTHLKSLSRMTYGALCFGLMFSVVGTILGGIWANDSWGRFWGWDPKENGALLICLSQIAILHLRMGGYLRDFGIAMATAFQGTVIAFSWFGVNLLGVGLHSYGFTAGISMALWSYYIGQWGLMAIAGIHHMIERARQEALQSAAGARVAPETPAPRAAEGRAG